MIKLDFVWFMTKKCAYFLD